MVSLAGAAEKFHFLLEVVSHSFQLPRYRRLMAKSTETPWGRARVVEEVRVQQRAADRRFASLVQRLEDERGETLVRIAYTTDGVVRRGPVTLRLRDLERLRAKVGAASGLADVLGWSGA